MKLDIVKDVMLKFDSQPCRGILQIPVNLFG